MTAKHYFPTEIAFFPEPGEKATSSSNILSFPDEGEGLMA